MKMDELWYSSNVLYIIPAFIIEYIFNSQSIVLHLKILDKSNTLHLKILDKCYSCSCGHYLAKQQSQLVFCLGLTLTGGSSAMVIFGGDAGSQLTAIIDTGEARVEVSGGTYTSQTPQQTIQAQLRPHWPIMKGPLARCEQAQKAQACVASIVRLCYGPLHAV